VTTLGGLICGYMRYTGISLHVNMRRNSLHMRHDMESCDQVEKIKTRLGLTDRLRWWRASWVMTWRRRTDATVKSKWGQDRWTNAITWWYGMDHIIVGMVGACVASTSE